MTCPKCFENTKVIDSRPDDETVMRRRECLVCGFRFVTIEIDKDLYERTVKKDD